MAKKVEVTLQNKQQIKEVQEKIRELVALLPHEDAINILSELFFENPPNVKAEF